MPKETKEYQVSEESDLYHTINHRVKSFTELLRLKESLIDHQNSLEERRNKIVEMNREHYGEDPYAIQELDAMYIGLRKWIKRYSSWRQLSYLTFGDIKQTLMKLRKELNKEYTTIL